ncbi:MAG: hypothetical protein ACLUD2_13660 [Clostridium sp.]
MIEMKDQSESIPISQSGQQTGPYPKRDRAMLLRHFVKNPRMMGCLFFGMARLSFCHCSGVPGIKETMVSDHFVAMFRDVLMSKEIKIQRRDTFLTKKRLFSWR